MNSRSYYITQKWIHNKADTVKKTFDIVRMIETNNQENKMSEKDLYMREMKYGEE